jgi:hypothetical protein
MDVFLNTVSVIGTFFCVFGLLFFVQRYTIGFLPFFKKQLKNQLSIGDVFFSITSIMFIVFFVDFYTPY